MVVTFSFFLNLLVVLCISRLKDEIFVDFLGTEY